LVVVSRSDSFRATECLIGHGIVDEDAEGTGMRTQWRIQQEFCRIGQNDFDPINLNEYVLPSYRKLHLVSTIELRTQYRPWPPLGQQ